MKLRAKALWVLMGDGGAKLFGLLATLTLARAYGVESYGEITYALSILGVAGLFTDLGLHTLGTRNSAIRVSRSAEVEAEVAVAEMRLRMTRRITIRLTPRKRSIALPTPSMHTPSMPTPPTSSGSASSWHSPSSPSSASSSGAPSPANLNSAHSHSSFCYQSSRNPSKPSGISAAPNDSAGTPSPDGFNHSRTLSACFSSSKPKTSSWSPYYSAYPSSAPSYSNGPATNPFANSFSAPKPMPGNHSSAPACTSLPAASCSKPSFSYPLSSWKRASASISWAYSEPCSNSYWPR